MKTKLYFKVTFGRHELVLSTALYNPIVNLYANDHHLRTMKKADILSVYNELAQDRDQIIVAAKQYIPIKAVETLIDDLIDQVFRAITIEDIPESDPPLNLGYAAVLPIESKKRTKR